MLRATSTILLLLVLPLTMTTGASPPDPAISSYRLSFPDRANHYAEVEASLPSDGGASLELWIPAWTPGSYKIRDYARFLEEVSARAPDGTPLAIEKTAKDRWRVTTDGARRVLLSYRIYGREMSVRTNWIERDFAMLNGAATFIVAAGREAGPIDLTIDLPPDWPHCETGLPPHPDGGRGRFRAPDHDTLVDCPIVIGDLAVRRFEVGGVPHLLVCHGGEDLWDFDRAARDVERIVAAQIAMWGDVPYASYRFLNLIVESGGGLEHSNSTLMLASRYAFRDADRYRRWLGLVSHEFFHTWNIKRLRPIALGPFDYTREVHTDDLWVVEGITSYYDDLMLARAGLTDAKEYLKALSGQIGSLQRTPGRQVHALSETSHDAWTHYYQRHENSLNTTISYYTKGAVVAFLLDGEIRRLSAGARSLDDAMRSAYERYSGERGYTSEEFRACCEEAAGADLDAFFAVAVESRDELDYVPALEWFGLRFQPIDDAGDEDAEESEGGEDESDAPPTVSEDPTHDPTPGWIGLRSTDRGGRLVVTAVARDTPAHAIGLNVDDEIIAVDRYRVTAGGWKSRMAQYSPGDTVTLLVARRGEIRTFSVTLAEAPDETWKLEIDPDATPEQKARLAAWLGAAGVAMLEAEAEKEDGETDSSEDAGEKTDDGRSP